MWIEIERLELRSRPVQMQILNHSTELCLIVSNLNINYDPKSVVVIGKEIKCFS